MFHHDTRIAIDPKHWTHHAAWPNCDNLLSYDCLLGSCVLRLSAPHLPVSKVDLGIWAQGTARPILSLRLVPELLQRKDDLHQTPVIPSLRPNQLVGAPVIPSLQPSLGNRPPPSSPAVSSHVFFVRLARIHLQEPRELPTVGWPPR